MKLLFVLALPLLFTSLFAKTISCPEPQVDNAAFTPENAVSIIPKNRSYTQGLVFRDGLIYESTGLYGSSRLYEIDPKSSTRRLIHSLPVFFFAEGLAFLNGNFYQLTWRERTAFIYSLEQIESGEVLNTEDVRREYYSGEGWGLAPLGDNLVKSDGTSTLGILDPSNLDEIDTLDVRVGSSASGKLNELEIVKGRIFANVYVDQAILAIGASTGCVERVFALDKLFSFSFPECEKCGQFPSDYVANGIAYDPDGEKLYLTGKNWPFIFVFDY